MSADQPTPVIATVTGADLIEKIDKLAAQVAELVGKFGDVPRQLHDHETRIRALERRLWMALGAASVVGAVAGWFLRQMGR